MARGQLDGHNVNHMAVAPPPGRRETELGPGRVFGGEGGGQTEGEQLSVEERRRRLLAALEACGS